MPQSRRSQFFVVLGLCAAAGLTTAVAVAGEKQAKISATGFQTEAAESGEAFAKCKGEKRALGGGVIQSGAMGPSEFWVQASGPLDASGTPNGTQDGDVAKRWFAAVENVSETRNYKVFAICARAPKATIEVSPLSIDNGETGKKFVKCSGSRRALGGGVIHIDSPDGTAIESSGPVDRSGEVAKTKNGDVAKSWYTAVINGSGENHRSFRVFAISAKDSNATIATERFTVPGWPGGAEKYVVCPGSKRAVGGGVASIGSPSGFNVMASGPLNSTNTTSTTNDGDVAIQWYAALANGSNNDKEAKVSVICV